MSECIWLHEFSHDTEVHDRYSVGVHEVTGITSSAGVVNLGINKNNAIISVGFISDHWGIVIPTCHGAIETWRAYCLNSNLEPIANTSVTVRVAYIDTNAYATS